jgi:hypothetical protein
MRRWNEAMGIDGVAGGAICDGAAGAQGTADGGAWKVVAPASRGVCGAT